MSTQPPTKNTESAPKATPEHRKDGFEVVGSDRSLGFNLPQKMGKTLWAPMFAMALMAFIAAVILGFVRADVVNTRPDDAVALLQLRHVTAAVMFIGFTTVLSGIAFAIAKILGTFRDGGGKLQESVLGHVQTLKMPVTAKAMVALMMMGMMAIIIAVIAHFVAAADTTSANLASSEQQFAAWEIVRRIGVSLHLVAIAFGLFTIVHVLRFQAVRIREVAAQRAGGSG
ncbi:MAG: hypothetical protein WD358_01550 [Nitriliruptoraceae bacterium]